MKTTLHFKDLLRSPVGKNVGDTKLCQILDNLLRARHAIVKGAPNAYEVMMQGGRKSLHIQLPHEETYLYHVHPAGGGCLIREEELEHAHRRVKTAGVETGSSVNDEVEKVILKCRNSRELNQDVTNKLIRRPYGQWELRDYDNVLVMTDLLFALRDHGARALGLLEVPANPQEPMRLENDARAGRGSYHTKKTTLESVLNKVFPNGVPSRDELPDMELIHAVTKKPCFYSYEKKRLCT